MKCFVAEQCGTSSTGNQFLVMFLANLEQDERRLELSLTSPDSNVGQTLVDVFAPLDDGEFRQLVPVNAGQVTSRFNYELTVFW